MTSQLLAALIERTLQHPISLRIAGYRHSVSRVGASRDAALVLVDSCRRAFKRTRTGIQEKAPGPPPAFSHHTERAPTPAASVRTGAPVQATDLGVRAMTPRAMAGLSLDLYLRGLISQAEYRLLAFQPDLHSGFERTIGALTGRTAQPDRPRDYIQLWQERLAFEASHGPVDPIRVNRTRAILDVLTRLDRLADCRPAATNQIPHPSPQPLAATR